MSAILNQIFGLISRGEVRVSEHGYDEIDADQISVRDIVEGVLQAILIEEYPDYPKGRCVLVVQRDRQGNPIHVVWGIPRDSDSPAVVVTAYRPDPGRWEDDFSRRV
ncbi:MAG: DUF4258 domain-containing protein [Acidobacteriota bacterium]